MSSLGTSGRGTILKVLILFGWLVGILLPMYSFRSLSPEYREVFDRVFRTQAAHVLMHLFLYAVLACLVASFLPASVRRSRGRTVVVTLLAVGVVGILQEVIQMRAKAGMPGADEFFDLGVDLAGGLLGIAAFLSVRRWRRGRTADPRP